MINFCKFIPGNEVNNVIYKAIFSGDLEKINAIIEKYGLDYSSAWKGGYELLLTAIDCKHYDVAKLLINKGCKLECKETEPSETTESLIHTIVKHGNVELMNMVLDRDKQFITKISKGNTVLHIAAEEGHLDVLEQLLKRGAEIMPRNSLGMTPLHKAAVMGHVDILSLLLEFGADIESQDNKGKRSLFLAVLSGQKAAVKFLLERGANCNWKENNCLAPLLIATSEGNLEIFKNLLNFGADVNAKNILGQTPLHIACVMKNKVLVSLLLSAGADVNATDSRGLVPSDAIVKTRSTGCFLNYFFENVPLAYLLGKHLIMLKVGGLHLNERNESFYKLFYRTYCKDISAGDEFLAEKSELLESISFKCKEEISKMKHLKSGNGYTLFDIFEKLKISLNVITEREIQFLQSVNIEEEFIIYGTIIKNLLKQAVYRKELITSAQEQFWLLISKPETPLLPEELQFHILSYLSNDDLKQLIYCGKR